MCCAARHCRHYAKQRTFQFRARRSRRRRRHRRIARNHNGRVCRGQVRGTLSYSCFWVVSGRPVSLLVLALMPETRDAPCGHIAAPCYAVGGAEGTPSVVDAVVKKVAEKRITNSKDLRKLRQILPDPVAKHHFMSEDGDIKTAMLRLEGPAKNVKGGFSSDLEAVVPSMKQVPWTALTELKQDPEILKKIDEASELLVALRKTLSS